MLTKADLRGTVLTNADLRGADLRGADLKGTNLTNANLLPHDEQDPERWSLSNLTSLDLSGERLRPSRLTLRLRRYRWLTWLLPKLSRRTSTNLNEAALTGACLRKAYLGGADLSDADLRDADLSGANLHDAIGVDVNVLEQQVRSLRGATMPDGSVHD